jgi:hypothetical protein
MASFLRLSSVIVNLSHVRKIVIQPDLYKIHMNRFDVDGFWVAASGGVSSNDDVLKVCKYNDPQDYQIVDEWVEKR